VSAPGLRQDPPPFPAPPPRLVHWSVLILTLSAPSNVLPPVQGVDNVISQLGRADDSDIQAVAERDEKRAAREAKKEAAAAKKKAGKAGGAGGEEQTEAGAWGAPGGGGGGGGPGGGGRRCAWMAGWSVELGSRLLLARGVYHVLGRDVGAAGGRGGASGRTNGSSKRTRVPSPQCPDAGAGDTSAAVEPAAGGRRKRTKAEREAAARDEGAGLSAQQQMAMNFM
jgi:hypothetical protein